MPVVLMALMLGVHFGLAYHARQVVAGAAQDGAAAGAREGSSPAAGAALADSLIEQGAGASVTSHSTSGSSDGERVYVHATAEVVSIFGFFSQTVSATGSAAIEEFTPQGADSP